MPTRKIMLRNALEEITNQCEQPKPDVKIILKAIKKINAFVEDAFSCPLKNEDCPLTTALLLLNKGKKDKK